MRKRLMILATVMAALALLASGSWWVWKGFIAPQRLTDAVWEGDAARVKKLLAWGADPDNGDTFTASVRGCHEVLQILIDHGADPHIVASDGSTLMTSAEDGQVFRRATGFLPGQDCEKTFLVLEKYGLKRTPGWKRISWPSDEEIKSRQKKRRPAPAPTEAP